MSICIKDQIQNMNLVIGCTIGCSYCYARNNARRFHMTEDFHNPQYFPNKLRMIDRKCPRNLLLTGMSDFSDWKIGWQEDVFAKIKENTQHQYIFLTKRPDAIHFSTDMENVWFGVTVTSSKEKERIQVMRKHIHAKHYQVSFEPMFDDIGEVDLLGIEWIVIGTETGNRKGKSITKKEWVMNLINQAKSLEIPVFMKEDLLPIMGEKAMIQELPASFYEVLKEQQKWKKKK